MSRIVIHASFHKTGTSTLQAWLGAARGPLRPHAKIVPARGMQALLHACRACSTLPEPKSPAKVAARAEAFARGIAGLKGRALILSAEALSGHPPGRPGIDSCAAGFALPAELTAALARRFPRAALPPLRHRNAARPSALDDLLHINRTISDRTARRDAKTARPRQAAGTR